MTPDPIIPKNTTLANLASDINIAHAAACAAVQSAIKHARRAGDLLIHAKAQVAHGAWLPWLLDHCPDLSEQQAQRYMRVARRWPELEAKATRVTDLPLRDALAMLAEPRTTADDLPILSDPLPPDFDWRARVWETVAAEDAIKAERDALLKTEFEDITIEVCLDIISRADAFAARASRLRFIAERDLGFILKQAPWVEVFLEHPELLPGFLAQCEQRIGELGGAS